MTAHHFLVEHGCKAETWGNLINRRALVSWTRAALVDLLRSGISLITPLTSLRRAAQTDDALRTLDRVTLTAHSGYNTKAALTMFAEPSIWRRSAGDRAGASIVILADWDSCFLL
jgi:hypothetical protein